MNRIAFLILILALPALVFPFGLSVCVCEDCGCDRHQVKEAPSCCSKAAQPEKKAKTCDRFEVEGVDQDFDSPVFEPDFTIPCCETMQLTSTMVIESSTAANVAKPAVTPPPRLTPLLV